MARGSGDIVYEIGGTADSLIAAATSGSKSLRAMERDAKALQTQIDRMGKVQADYQRALNQTIGVQDRVAKSAKASAQVFREWESASKQVNALRASIDPLYAASQRYEQALETLDAAVQKGIISQAEHTRMVDMAGKAFLTAGGQADQSASQIGGFAGIMARNRAAVQMFGYNVQDVAVQLAAGTRATTVFAQQGSQMLGALGPYGALAGAALAVTLPLAGAFFSAGEGAAAATEQINRLKEAQDQIAESAVKTQSEIDKLRFGVDEGYQVELLNEQIRLRGEINQKIAEAARVSQTFLGDERARAQYISDINTELADMAARYNEISRQLSDQQNRSAQLAIIAGQRAQAEAEAAARASEMAELLDLAAQGMWHLSSFVPGPGWLSSAISQADILAAKLWDASDAANAVSFGGGASPMTAQDLNGSPVFVAGSGWTSGESAKRKGRTSVSGGGGGGGGVDQLEALKQSLMSEAEVEMAAYAERQAMLEQALEAKRLTLEEYNRLFEMMQTQHQEKMSEIDVWRYGSALDKAEAFFGEMASAMQGGNDAMVRMARAFGAIEALINAWRAYSQVLADPSLPWFAKLPKAAAVLAAGMGAVNAIKGGGSSAKPSASTGTATAAAQSPATVNIQWTGAMTADSMGSLTKKLNAEYKQGYRLNFVAA